MRKPKQEILKLDFSNQPVMVWFKRVVSEGLASEILCLGARGDGKTIGILTAMMEHAWRHEAAGYPLPVPWMGVRDTFSNHKLTTIKTLIKPMWAGCWELTDQGHTALCFVNGQCLVELRLFGLEDTTAMDKLRQEVVGIWFEEVAPAAGLVNSLGISADAWATAKGSRRVPSHCKPAVITTNYPEEDHWSWQHFQPIDRETSMEPYVGYHPEFGAESIAPRMWIQIPPGERASAEDRALNMEALKDRPDLLRRLFQGRPGSVSLGPQVAVGFRADKHVAKARLRPVKHEPLCFGQDGGLCYDDKTEVLTDKGWHRFSEVPAGAAFATLNTETRQLEYQYPSRTIRQRHKGKMYHWDGESVNLCVSPDHTILWMRDQDVQQRIRRSTAEEIATKGTTHIGVPLKAKWRGVDKVANPLNWPTELFAQFMGWYLSEGSCEPNTNRISIAQSKPDHMDALMRVLAQTGLEWHQGETRFRASNDILADYLKQFGLQPVRFIPESIRALNPELLGLFLDAYTMGDGSVRKRLGKTDEHVIHTSSKRITDDMQEVALKLGWSSSVTTLEPASAWYEAERRWIESQGGYRVRFKKSSPMARLLPKNLTVLDYDGEIFCVTVPNHSLYVRREGTPCWSGNCPATIIGQPIGNELRIYAALPMDRGGMRQQYEFNVIPWLRQNAPWALKDSSMIYGCYDPSLPDDESDSDRNPIDVIEELLGGRWEPGPVDWESRKGALLSSMNMTVGLEPALQIDPVEGRPLVQALSNRWYYAQDRTGNIIRDKPKSPCHPWEDVGQAYCYWLCAALPETNRSAAKPIKVETDFNPSQSYDHAVEIKVETDFDVG